MNLREQSIAAYPSFPWLDLHDPQGVAECLRGQGALASGESVVGVSSAGAGNMNLTLRVETDRRVFVLKQARPWVEKYDHIAAPWDRVLYEQRFYRRVAEIGEVASRSPELISVDESSKTIAMEYVENSGDYTDAYAEAGISGDDLSALANYAAALHGATRGSFDESLANHDMRALNHEHIFVIPFAQDNGLELEAYEAGLGEAAGALHGDGALRDAVGALGERYLGQGPCLLHGDFFPGSWLRTSRGPVVIDPEFCFFGDPEFDVGVAVAHLALARCPAADVSGFVDGYERSGGSLDTALVAGFAGVEVIRRIAGVAQLPIPPSTGFRGELLRRARVAVVDGTVGSLTGEME